MGFLRTAASAAAGMHVAKRLSQGKDAGIVGDLMIFKLLGDAKQASHAFVEMQQQGMQVQAELVEQMQALLPAAREAAMTDEERASRELYRQMRAPARPDPSTIKPSGGWAEWHREEAARKAQCEAQETLNQQAWEAKVDRFFDPISNVAKKIDAFFARLFGKTAPATDNVVQFPTR